MVWIWIVLTLVVTALVYLFMLPAAYNVRRSQVMNANAARVFEGVQDFHQWLHWNPWLLHDPQTELRYEGDGRSVGTAYTWRSPKIGEGRVRHVQMQAPQHLVMALEFFKPFKSKAEVRFDVKAMDEAHTEVVWTMSSQLPLVMRPLRAMFERMIGTDFELGLSRMAGWLDPTCEHPRIVFVGEVQQPAQRVVYEAYAGPLAGLAHFFDPAYARLSQAVGSAKTGPAMAAYDKVDVKAQTTQGCAALPVADGFVPVATVPTKTLPGGRYFHVRLHGHYRFLAQAWHAASGQARMQKFKFDTRRPALEVYPCDKQQLPNSNDWVTELYLPIR